MKPHELRQQKTAKLAAARVFIDKAEGENRELSTEERAAFDGFMGEANSLEARAKQIEDFDAIAARTEESVGRTGEPLPHNDPANTRGGRHEYSVLRALRSQLPNSGGLSGIELEVHAELAKRKGTEVKGVLVPWDLGIDEARSGAFARANGVESRDLTTTTGVGGVYTVKAKTLIELLRNKMLARQLGVRVMADLNGKFSIPRQSGAGSASWNGEGVAPGASNQTVDSVDFTPKTLGANTVFSRAFLAQTAIDAEQFVREDLTTVIAIELDRVAFNGSGSGSIPTGVLPYSGLTTVALGTNGAAPTWASVVNLESNLDSANALNGSLAYVTTPAGRSVLKRTTKVASSTFGDFLWETRGSANGVGDINGYPAYSTNQLPANLTKGTGTALSAAIFGDWSQAIYALWSGMDVLVDPYTGGSSGNVKVAVLQDADFNIRHIAAFSAIVDMVTT